jgi:hypothetical protein
MSYPARPQAPAVEAVQDRFTDVAVGPDATRFAGAVGGDVHVPPVVMTLTAAVNADTLPAASRARTWYRYSVPAVRPVLVNEFVVDVPTEAKVPVVPVARKMS